tara:strand:+ start:2475 stop:2987 length:513 start_codon:yes stop_codon:yes gene_type:complete
MKNRFIIPVELIKNKGYTQKNVNDDVLTTTLRRVQDINVRPILGTTFFKRILNGVEASDLNADEILLIDEYIAPFLVAQVDYRVTNHVAFEIRNKTVGTSDDQYISTADRPDMKDLRDDLSSDAVVYKGVLIGYLKDNIDLYPEYKEFICSFENVPPEKDQGAEPMISFI